MSTVLERTTKEDQKLAISSLYKIRQAKLKAKRSSDSTYARIKLDEKGEYLRIPRKALNLLISILSNMAEGKSVTLVPSDAVITTQQAADMLNISRPHLVKLLKDGIIPFKKIGTHRRISIKDLISYEKKTQENQKQQLNFLARQAQELNLGY